MFSEIALNKYRDVAHFTNLEALSISGTQPHLLAWEIKYEVTSGDKLFLTHPTFLTENVLQFSMVELLNDIGNIFVFYVNRSENFTAWGLQ